MKGHRQYFIILFLIYSFQSFSQQASLTIKNKSDRYLTVKVMKGTERKSVLHKIDSVAPKSSQIIFFDESGLYFTKTQAVLINKDDSSLNDTLYSKSNPFQVISDKRRGFSNITIEFKVKESKKPDKVAMPITRKEYDN